MIFALGFLAASLIALAVAPAFWRRAIRLSTRRLEMQLPLSSEEIVAERDLLRAEFAVAIRQIEQKVEALNGERAADLAELGRLSAALAGQEAALRVAAEQNRELSQELAAAKRAAAETSAELAAIDKNSYDTEGLIARKESIIKDLKAGLEEVQARSERQHETIEAQEALMAGLKKALAAEIAKTQHLESELSTMQLQHQADQVTLKAAAARVADREHALEAAAKREKELLRLRKLQTETARATESGYLEKIERLRGAHVQSEAALDTAHRTCERLTKELDELRAVLPAQGTDAILKQREENEILRQKLNELGAAIIRAATDGARDLQEKPVHPGDGGEAAEGEVAEKETA